MGEEASIWHPHHYGIGKQQTRDRCPADRVRGKKRSDAIFTRYRDVFTYIYLVYIFYINIWRTALLLYCSTLRNMWAFYTFRSNRIERSAVTKKPLSWHCRSFTGSQCGLVFCRCIIQYNSPDRGGGAGLGWAGEPAYGNLPANQ